MVFLGIHLDTLAMSMSITPERLQELLHRCSSALSLSYISRHDLQSLLGVMSFVTARVRPAVLSCQPFSTPSALTGTLATAFYLTTIGQTSSGGASPQWRISHQDEDQN